MHYNSDQGIYQWILEQQSATLGAARGRRLRRSRARLALACVSAASLALVFYLALASARLHTPHDLPTTVHTGGDAAAAAAAAQGDAAAAGAAAGQQADAVGAAEAVAADFSMLDPRELADADDQQQQQQRQQDAVGGDAAAAAGEQWDGGGAGQAAAAGQQQAGAGGGAGGAAAAAAGEDGAAGGGSTGTAATAAGTFSDPLRLDAPPSTTAWLSVAHGHLSLSPAAAAICGYRPDTFGTQRKLVLAYHEDRLDAEAAPTQFALCNSDNFMQNLWLISCRRRLADEGGADVGDAGCFCQLADGGKLAPCPTSMYGWRSTVQTQQGYWYYVVVQANPPDTGDDAGHQFAIDVDRGVLPTRVRRAGRRRRL